MRSRILCVLLGLAMGWTTGCATTRVSYPPKGEEQPEQHPRPIPTPGRQIGLLKWGSTCPPVYGWRTESLLELAVAHAEDGIKNSCDPNNPPPKRTRIDRERQAKVDALFRKHGLDRICVYTDQGAGRPFRKPVRLSKVGPDKLALTPNAPTDLDSLGNQIWKPLAQRFLDQVGTVQLDSAQDPVRLVFVDTHPTGEGLPARNPAPNSWHGYGMAHLGYELVCGHGTSLSCPIHVATRLALRYDDYQSASPDDPGSDNGGHQGRIGDLAAAIAEEIWHWQTHDPQSKLILNLSVGWDSEYNDPDTDRRQELDAATQAVYKALDSAHDLGVLVIAAAGNRSGGQNSQWPLLPAAWELRAPNGSSGSPSKRIVYAVGGVDWQGLPLPNARPDGMPSLVAYADHAVTKTSDGAGGAEPTKIYTGSSVAAVVASSTAAVVWHLRPGLTQDQVMERMDDAAEPFPRPATYPSPPGGQPGLRRLRLCKTVISLCADGGPCPDTGSISCPEDRPPADLSGIIPHDASPVVFSTAGPPLCDPQTQVYKDAGDSTPEADSETHRCPMEKLLDMNAPSLVQTLPPDTPCPTCSIAPGFSANLVASLAPLPEGLTAENPNVPKSYDLAVAIDSDWLEMAKQADTKIASAILVIDCTADSTLKERLDLTTQFSTLLDSARRATSPLLPLRVNFGPIGQRTTLKGCTASVDFKLNVPGNGERSVQSPVYVDP